MEIWKCTVTWCIWWAHLYCLPIIWVCLLLWAGGNLRSMRSSLKLVGPAEHIPSKIEVDVSQLDIEDKVLLQEVVFHPSLKLLSKNETLPVCKIAATSPVKEQESCSSISKVLEKVIRCPILWNFLTRKESRFFRITFFFSSSLDKPF